MKYNDIYYTNLGAFKYYAILLGGESPKRSQKITKGEGGFTKRSQRITITRRGGGIKKIGQIGGAYKDNNYSQDQISVGDSGGDIFIDKH